MSNPFDQFDAPQPTLTTPGGNPFDQFDAPEPKPAAPPPPETLSQSVNNYATGIHHGLYDIPQNLALYAAKASDAVGLTSGAHDKIQQGLNFYNDADYANQGANPQSKYTKGGQFVGDLVGSAPLSELGPVRGGAAMGFLLSDKPTAAGVAEDTGLGAAGGKLGDLASRGLGRLLSVSASPQVKQLLSEGVQLTPGQILGGGFKTAEDKLTSVPFAGTSIANAQTRATESFNRAALNRALGPLGQTLPDTVPVGREGVDHVYSAIQDSYDSLIPQMQGVADNQLKSDFNSIGQKAIGQGVKQDVVDRFKNVLQAQVADRTVNGQLTGQALKDAQSNLGNVGRSLATSQDADSREVGRMVLDAHSAFNDMLTRNNPALAPQLKATNTAFANYARIRKAASYTGAQDGVFTPAQLSRAVQSSDKSAGKGAYARGQALMQDLTDPAKAVLPSKVGDSGTAGRLMGASPLALGKGAIAGLPLSLAYSEPGIRGITAALTQRGPAAQAVGRGLTRLQLPATVAGSGLLSQANQ